MIVLLVLGIDTSGKNASVALMSEEKMLAQYFVETQKTHSQVILPLCEKMLGDLGKTVKDVDRFAIAAGPGSYTGLRIGISAIKALAFGLDKECSGVSTLESIAYNFIGCDKTVCTVMKARLDIVYCAVYRTSGNEVTEVMGDCMMKMSELIEKLKAMKTPVVAAGDAAAALAEEAADPDITLAPAHLRMQLASGICMCAMNKKGQSPYELNAVYMQITKAEKDLLEKENQNN